MVTLLATRMGSRTGVTVALSLEQPQLAWGHAILPSSSLFAPSPALRTFSNMSSSGSGQSVPETAHQRLKPPKGWRPAEVPIPFTGWYLAFRIDVKATLPFLREEDAAAFRQRSNVYVGYLETASDTRGYALMYSMLIRSQLSGLFNPERSIHTGSVALLSSILSSDEKRFRTTDMAIAMSPNTQVIAGREPMQTEPPLPWANSFHYTVDGGIPRVRIKSKMLSCLNHYKLSSDELWQMTCYAVQDRKRRHALACAANRMFVFRLSKQLAERLFCQRTQPSS
jgi:hypothetical protein